MASLTPLSSGCLSVIMSGEPSNVEEPILQVLGTKKISSGGSSERYRVLLSDGKHLQSFTMLATQLNVYVINGELTDFTIIKVKQHVTSVVNKTDKNEKRVLIILDLEVLHKGTEVGKKIGEPVSLTETTNGTANATPKTEPDTKPTFPKTEPSSNVKAEPTRPFGGNNTTSSGMNDSIIEGRSTLPISSLTPYQNKWVIKVRVTSKSAIRTWSNAKGEGKLFSMDLMDESGEIRCTAFRDAVDKYYDMIQVDKVYLISKCQLKPANKQFSSIKNDYEMTFNNDTVVQECANTDDDIPAVQYSFVPIQQIQSMEPNAVLDVIGVCRSTGDVQTFTAKSSGRELKKRELTIVDNSNAAINITLWGNDAETFNDFGQPVVLVKNGRLSEFNGGKSVSLGSGSSLKINPDCVEGHRLRGWFDNGGGENITTSISARSGDGGSFATEWLTFHEAKLKDLGSGEKPDYFQVKALVHIIRENNAVYKACPQADCNKKVVDNENGTYRCEKCNAEYPNFKYRLMVSMSIGDWTANRWVTCFSDVAEKILNRTSQEVGEALEHSKEAGDAILTAINFKSFIFKLRSKNEFYGDTSRNKITVQSASPVNYKEYNQHLIKKIQELTGVGKH